MNTEQDYRVDFIMKKEIHQLKKRDDFLTSQRPPFLKGRNIHTTNSSTAREMDRYPLCP